MEITSNYSVLNLFVKENKEVKIFIDRQVITIFLKSLRDFFSNDEWTTCYTIISRDEYRKKLLATQFQSPDSLTEIKNLIFEFSLYDQYTKITDLLREQLSSFIKDLEFDFQKKELIANDVIITSDIWNYIIYILKLSCGEKEEKPPIFEDEYARQLYLAQKEFEKQVNKIKNKGGDTDQILKILLTISYQIPALTFDYLFNQTMAQIHWLYNYAAKSVSYRISEKVFAAGNMKQGKTPEFFIK